MDFTLTRCPVCGSTALTPFCEDSKKQDTIKMLFFGIIGIAVEAARCKNKKNRVYWMCNYCGTQFEDIE